MGWGGEWKGSGGGNVLFSRHNDDNSRERTILKVFTIEQRQLWRISYSLLLIIDIHLLVMFLFVFVLIFLLLFFSAQPLFTEEVNLLSLPERKFGVGWALLVEFIAATHFQTDLNNTAEQQYALPPRILKSDDEAPFIPDLSPAQNRALLAINFFHSTNDDSKGLLLKFWRRAMCSPKGRAIGRDLLENIIDDPWIIPRKLFKLLWGLLIYPC